jgi:hypothetical protein
MVWPDRFAITFTYNATLQSFWEGTASSGYTPMAFYYNALNRLDWMGRSNVVGRGIGYNEVSRLNGASLYCPCPTWTAQEVIVTTSGGEVSPGNFNPSTIVVSPGSDIDAGGGPGSKRCD